MEKAIKILFVIDTVMLLFLLVMFMKANAEYVTAPEGVNVRSEPGTDAEILEVVPFAEEVAGEIEAGWMRLEGREGYVKAEYLSVDNPLEDMTYMGEWRTTAYAYTGSPCANGEYPEEGYTIACNSLSFGTKVYIAGAGFRVVEDRGPASMGDAWLDIYMANVEDCIQWGDRYLDVYVVEE